MKTTAMILHLNQRRQAGSYDFLHQIGKIKESGNNLLLLLLLLLTYLLTAIQLSLGGSSPYTSTDKTNNK